MINNKMLNNKSLGSLVFLSKYDAKYMHKYKLQIGITFLTVSITSSSLNTPLGINA